MEGRRYKYGRSPPFRGMDGWFVEGGENPRVQGRSCILTRLELLELLLHSTPGTATATAATIVTSYVVPATPFQLMIPGAGKRPIVLRHDLLDWSLVGVL